jgi:menaquinone-dependent protoporphyrinogen oxidase
MKVLVTYATRHGSTRGIAEHVGQVLLDAGLDVTVSSAKEAPDAHDFDAFVVGGAAYGWHWMKDATEFVRRNESVLVSHPTWIFSSGPIGTDRVDGKGNDVLETARPKEFAQLAAEIKPRDLHVFFGAYDPDDPPVDIAERLMKASMRLMPAMKNALPAGDFREWPVIEEWAAGIARELGEKGQAVATSV